MWQDSQSFSLLPHWPCEKKFQFKHMAISLWRKIGMKLGEWGECDAMVLRTKFHPVKEHDGYTCVVEFTFFPIFSRIGHMDGYTNVPKFTSFLSFSQVKGFILYIF